MLTKFTLPSRPEVEITLREATVSDAIDFSAVDPDCEEEVTTMFLSRVQEKDAYSDPREWTGEDRRYALFMYDASTSPHKSIPISFNCPTCGKPHTVDIDRSTILDTYTPIAGKPVREIVHDGHNIRVHPLNGGDLELLEKYHYDLSLTEEALNEDDLPPQRVKALTEEARRKRVRLNMFRVFCLLDMPFLDENTTRATRRPLVEEYITKMPASEFGELFRLELEYKDMELILQSVFRRHFGHLPVTWFPIFAPLHQPYGTLFEPYGGLGNEPDKNIPPKGMFLTSRGRLGVDKDALFRAGLTKAKFRELSTPLVRRTKPLHIVYDGLIWYIRFDLPFESELSAQWEAESQYPLLFSTLGTRLDFTPDGWGQLDSSFTLTRNIEREMALPFISDRLARDLWRLDLRFPEGLPEGWLPLDCVVPGVEGVNVCPLSIFLSESSTPFSFALAKPEMGIERKVGRKLPAPYQVGFSASEIGERRLTVSFLRDYPLSTVDEILPEGFPEGWLPLDYARRSIEGGRPLPMRMVFAESHSTAPVAFVRPGTFAYADSSRSMRWEARAQAEITTQEERHFSMPFFHSVAARTLDSSMSEGFSESMIPADLPVAVAEGEEQPPLSILYAESHSHLPIHGRRATGDMACRQRTKTPLSPAHFEPLPSFMGKCSELLWDLNMSNFPRIDQQPEFDEIPADFMPLDICGGYANV